MNDPWNRCRMDLVRYKNRTQGEPFWFSFFSKLRRKKYINYKIDYLSLFRVPFPLSCTLQYLLNDWLIFLQTRRWMNPKEHNVYSIFTNFKKNVKIFDNYVNWRKCKNRHNRHPSLFAVLLFAVLTICGPENRGKPQITSEKI